jgi:hypothetical protein
MPLTTSLFTTQTDRPGSKLTLLGLVNQQRWQSLDQLQTAPQQTTLAQITHTQALVLDQLQLRLLTALLQPTVQLQQLHTQTTHTAHQLSQL